MPLALAVPKSVFKRDVDVSDWYGLFTELVGAGLNAALGNLPGMTDKLTEAAARAKLDLDVGERAWLLVRHAMGHAVLQLLAECRVDSVDAPAKLLAEQSARWCEEQYALPDHFWERPADAELVRDFVEPFAMMLECWGLSSARATSMAGRLPAAFVHGLRLAWSCKPEPYRAVFDWFSTTPGADLSSAAAKRAEDWRRYNAWLDAQVNQSLLGEPFSLRQIYVPLRAWWERDDAPADEHRHRDGDATRTTTRVVVNLKRELDRWLARFDGSDAVRVITGGPGSGKSSFCRMFAVHCAAKSDWRVVSVALQHVAADHPLDQQIAAQVGVPDLLGHDPFGAEAMPPRLLLILDGLDEVSLAGRAGREAADALVQSAVSLAAIHKQGGPRLAVLIAGRDVPVQLQPEQGRFQTEQVLHLLGYLADEDQWPRWDGPERLRQLDQRAAWWRRYGTLTGQVFDGLPTDLSGTKLQPVTAQPLHSFLLALARVGGEFTFTGEPNLNQVYERLVEGVHARRYAQPRPPRANPTAPPALADFLAVLEEIALCTWHGNGRTATLAAVRERCRGAHLAHLLDDHSADSESGALRLLTAFYFHLTGRDSDSERTFEFTHKSFGEYLAARRIVAAIEQASRLMEPDPRKPRSVVDPQEALREWARITGPAPIDWYLLPFVRDEVALRDQEAVRGWQQRLVDLVPVVLTEGLPMQDLGLVTCGEMARQARNAEEALLVAMDACARVTKQRSVVNWPDATSLGAWLNRLRGQPTGWAQTLPLRCLAHLGCAQASGGTVLVGADLIGGDLGGADLHNGDLRGANLSDADLRGTDLSGANLFRADLDGASLRDARLTGANLFRADLSDADLRCADLTGAYLYAAELSGADLRDADLSGAGLDGADLSDSNLSGADLSGAHLGNADLSRARFDSTTRPEALHSELIQRGARRAD